MRVSDQLVYKPIESQIKRSLRGRTRERDAARFKPRIYDDRRETHCEELDLYRIWLPRVHFYIVNNNKRSTGSYVTVTVIEDRG